VRKKEKRKKKEKNKKRTPKTRAFGCSKKATRGRKSATAERKASKRGN
jgi:hypothetical protein